MPSSHTTDSQIVERLLIPAMLQTITTVMRNDLGDDAAMFDPVSDLLTQAMREAVGAMLPAHAAKVLRRAQRVTRAAMQAIADQTMGAQWLAIAGLAVDLTARDYLAVGAESAFARAWDLMSEIMLQALELSGIDEEDAFRTGETLKRRLQAEGCYVDATCI